MLLVRLLRHPGLILMAGFLLTAGCGSSGHVQVEPDAIGGDVGADTSDHGATTDQGGDFAEALESPDVLEATEANDDGTDPEAWPSALTALPARDADEVSLAASIMIRLNESADTGTELILDDLDLVVLKEGSVTPEEGRIILSLDRRAVHFFPVHLWLPDTTYEATFTWEGQPLAWAFTTVADAGDLPFPGNAAAQAGQIVSFIIDPKTVLDPEALSGVLLGGLNLVPNVVAPVFIDAPINGLHPLMLAYGDPSDFDADETLEINHTTMGYRVRGEARGRYFLAQENDFTLRRRWGGQQSAQATVDFVHLAGEVLVSETTMTLEGHSAMFVSSCTDLYPIWDGDAGMAAVLDAVCDPDTDDFFGYALFAGQENAIEPLVFEAENIVTTPKMVTVRWDPPLEARHARMDASHTLFEITRDGMAFASSIDHEDWVDQFPEFVKVADGWYTFNEASFVIPDSDPLTFTPGTYHLRFIIGLYGFETTWTVAAAG